ncbi:MULTISPECIES: hypothetical protein [Maribellus]|uniref:hypothetical protein n=1 Tax=Maribellus TaxID=2678352 RepID=UPI00131E2041|nr:hypothetical protein [Maribellus maritimus]
MPSPTRSTFTSGTVWLISSACLSICRPITAPEAPPTAASVIDFNALLSEARLITGPAESLATVPSKVPFVVLSHMAQPVKIKTALKTTDKTIFLSFILLTV